jgi:hypothetical protein
MLPLAAIAPAAGDWLMTSPAGTVLLICPVTAAKNPADLIAVIAADPERPVTEGTLNCATGGAEFPPPAAPPQAAINSVTSTAQIRAHLRVISVSTKSEAMELSR